MNNMAKYLPRELLQKDTSKHLFLQTGIPYSMQRYYIIGEPQF